MNIVSKALTITLISTSFSAFAAEPLELKLGEAKLNGVIKKYSGQLVGTSRWTNGAIYNLNIEDLTVRGLLSAEAIFDTDDTLVGVSLKFRKDRFNELNSMAAKNYSPISSQMPFVGDKAVIYRDKDTVIELISPHMSFQMKVNYMHDSLAMSYKSGSQASQKQNKIKESNLLFGK